MIIAEAMSDARWSWLVARAAEVSAMGPDAVAELLSEELAKIDDRIAAEVHDVEGTREVMITAGGEADAFPLVRELVASAPALPRWSFSAFRPGRGFDFEVHAGPMVFDAKQLGFQPLSADEAPSQLAIRLLVPNPQLEEWAEIVLQIIEAGVGEEAAALIAYLEIDKRRDDSKNVFALESLPGWIERHRDAAG